MRIITRLLFLRKSYRVTEALDLCDKTLKIEPDNTSVLDSKFSILYDSCRMKEARECYYRIKQLEPSFSRINTKFLLTKAIPEIPLSSYDQLSLSNPNDEELIGNKEFALINHMRFEDRFKVDTVLDDYFLEYEISGNWEINNIENTPKFESKIAKASDNETCKISFLQLDDRKILKFKMGAIILGTPRKVRFIVMDLANEIPL